MQDLGLDEKAISFPRKIMLVVLRFLSTDGVGKVTGSLISAIVMMSLKNGMNLMGNYISTQYMDSGSSCLCGSI